MVRKAIRCQSVLKILLKSFNCPCRSPSTNRQRILEEIKRTAKENSGVPLGLRRFLKETQLKESDILGRYWTSWNDAVREAGFQPNEFILGYGSGVLVEKYIMLVREVGRIPSKWQLRLKRRQDPSFPNDKTFGPKHELISSVLEYCRNRSGFEDIVELCSRISSKSEKPPLRNKGMKEEGEVYLLKSGRFYKIGRTRSIGRREYELKIQLPQKPRLIHAIKTDDPVGIEEYWHKRFADKRKDGEWFDLDASDVQAFKNRRLM